MRTSMDRDRAGSIRAKKARAKAKAGFLKTRSAQKLRVSTRMAAVSTLQRRTCQQDAQIRRRKRSVSRAARNCGMKRNTVSSRDQREQTRAKATRLSPRA